MSPSFKNIKTPLEESSTILKEPVNKILPSRKKGKKPKSKRPKELIPTTQNSVLNSSNLSSLASYNLEYLGSRKVKISEEFLKEWNKEKKIKPKSGMRQFFSNIFNKVKSFIGRVAENRIFNNRVVKFIFKALTAVLQSRITGIILSTLAVAGIGVAMSNPLGAAIVLAAGITSLSVIGVATIIDVIKVRSFRKATEKNDLLKEYINNINKQQEICKIIERSHGHDLQETLKLSSHISDKTTTEKLSGNYKYEKVQYLGIAALGTVPGILNMAADIMTAVTGNPMSIFKVIKGVVITGVFAPYSAYQGNQTANEIIALKKDNINMLNEYNIKNSNIHSLREKVREETIKTNALVALVIDDEWQKLEDAKKLEKFKIYEVVFSKLIDDKNYMNFQVDKKVAAELFHEFEKRVAGGEKVKDLLKETQQKQKKTKVATEWARDIGNALNPFYSVPKTTKNKSPLTQAMEANAKRTEADIIPPSFTRSQSLVEATIPTKEIKTSYSVEKSLREYQKIDQNYVNYVNKLFDKTEEKKSATRNLSSSALHKKDISKLQRV